MGFFDAFKTPRDYTGVVIKKEPHTITDEEGDSVTRFVVTFKIESGDSAGHERSENVPRDIYDKVEVGNRVTKTVNDKQPIIHLGS